MDEKLINDQTVLEPEVLAKEEKHPAPRGWEKKPSDVSTAAKVIELHSKGMSYADITKIVNKSDATVRRIVEKFKPVFKHLEVVDEVRDIAADLCAAGKIAALESAFSGSKLKKAGFLSTLQGAELLNKMERLERGQSTENIDHHFVGKLTISD